MLQETADREEIIERVAALHIGKASLMCCARVPDEGRRGLHQPHRGGLRSRSAENAPDGSLVRAGCRAVTQVRLHEDRRCRELPAGE